eukprot:423407-Rhodomonas_salina.1
MEAEGWREERLPLEAQLRLADADDLLRHHAHLHTRSHPRLPPPTFSLSLSTLSGLACGVLQLSGGAGQ